MSDKNQISIKNLIVHKVDHHNYEEAILSELETPVPDDVAKFLSKHISSSIEHRYTNIANFVNGDVQEDADELESVKFREICNELLKDTNQFIEISRKIAKRLFNVVKKSKSISPCDLVICIFSDETESANKLALLKMDPEDGFRVEEEVRGSQLRFVLKRVPEVLPTGGLQKCAFILPESLRETKGYDLKVLDMQQKRYGVQTPAASFFTGQFLQCQVPPASEEDTNEFINQSNDWVEKKRKQWSQKDVDEFKKNLTESIMMDTVDVSSFARENIEKPDEQDEYLDDMMGKLNRLIFPPSPKVRSRMKKYVLFDGDNGLKVRINADAIGNRKTLRYNRDEITGKWIVTIKTLKWKERIT